MADSARTGCLTTTRTRAVVAPAGRATTAKLVSASTNWCSRSPEIYVNKQLSRMTPRTKCIKFGRVSSCFLLSRQPEKEVSSGCKFWDKNSCFVFLPTAGLFGFFSSRGRIRKVCCTDNIESSFTRKRCTCITAIKVKNGRNRWNSSGLLSKPGSSL